MGCDVYVPLVNVRLLTLDLLRFFTWVFSIKVNVESIAMCKSEINRIVTLASWAGDFI